MSKIYIKLFLCLLIFPLKLINKAIEIKQERSIIIAKEKVSLLDESIGYHYYEDCCIGELSFSAIYHSTQDQYSAEFTTNINNHAETWKYSEKNAKELFFQLKALFESEEKKCNSKDFSKT